ncbi:hypothetical protein ABPG74_011733 [Tetrahymena malaccensis]
MTSQQTVNLEKPKQNIDSAIVSQNEGYGNKNEQKLESNQNIMNYQKALHKIMSGENTMNQQFTKKNQQQSQGPFNFSALIKNQTQKANQCSDSPTNSQLSKMLRANSPSQKKEDQTALMRQQSNIQFEYIPRKEQGFENKKVAINQNNQKVVFVNFQIRNLPHVTINQGINALIYGTSATLCIPTNKYSCKVLIVMSTTSTDKLKIINVKKMTEKWIDITKICDVEYGIQNSNHQSIRGIDINKVISFTINDREETECLLQFDDGLTRDIFFQGFQYFVKQSHKTMINSGNIFKLRQQIESQILDDQNKTDSQTYDMNEILDIFESKVSMNISRGFLKKIYFDIIKRELDLQLTSQKITYIHYRKILSDNTCFQTPINNSQFLEIIDIMLDRKELVPIFEKAIQSDSKIKNKSQNQLSVEGFKQFILYHQKEIVSINEIQKIFQKIQSTEKKEQEEINQQMEQEKKQSKNEEQAEIINELEDDKSKRKNTISFQGFIRYIYSKNNSIFNPKKEHLYMNMNKPINEYYISSAKNIFHANFDIITMRQIAGFNYSDHEKYFPLLYVLSRGARYIEIEVWDGDGEPVIIYGPIMNSKLNVNEFLNQLSKQAFVINPFPLFLNIVPHCSIKQQFKLKYLIEKILGDRIYVLPPDYKEKANLPSPNDLKYKFILIGKLPHQYDGLIQEQYTTQDFIKLQQNQQQPVSNVTVSPQPQNLVTANNLTPEQATHQEIQPPHSNINLNNKSLDQIPPHSQNYLQPQQQTNNFPTLNTNNSQTALIPQTQNQLKSIQSNNQVDGTLLTPVRNFSYNNIQDFSIEQEMNQLILQEEMEENINVLLTQNKLISIKEKDSNNSTDQNGNQQPNRNSGIQEGLLRRGNPSTVKAIDNFFAKNLEAPKFKKFLQSKYDDSTPLNQAKQYSKSSDDSSSDYRNQEFQSDEIIEAQRGVYQNLHYNPASQRMQLTTERKSSTGSNQSPKQNSQKDRKQSLDNQGNQDQNLIPSTPPKNKKSSQLQIPTGNHGGGYQSMTQVSSTIFQVHCIRDYAPVLASNSIESLYSMYVSKIQKKKPALWEIYELSNRDLNQLKDNRLGYSVLSSYASIEQFTKYYLSITKPSCKPSDSLNECPIFYFNQGIQFVLCFFHTFDKNSLIYQSKFYENGGQTCGYILKPFQYRNHMAAAAAKRVRQKSTAVDDVGNQLFFNSKIDEQEEFLYENDEEAEELKMITANKQRRYYTQIRIISGYNIPTHHSEKVDPFVEMYVYDGDQILTYRTNSIENNNINPKWDQEFKFTINNPSCSYILFQVVNSSHQSLLGWYSIAFNNIRQGFRVVPLRDGFFNTVKNSFVLCEISIVRDNQGT